MFWVWFETMTSQKGPHRFFWKLPGWTPGLISVLHGVSGMQKLRILHIFDFEHVKCQFPTYFLIIPYHSLTPRSMKSGGEHSCHSSSRARKGTLSAWKEQLVHGKSSVLVRAGDPKFCWLAKWKLSGRPENLFQVSFRYSTATCYLPPTTVVGARTKVFCSFSQCTFFFIRNKYKKQRIRIFRISIADLRNSVVNFIENP